MARRPVLAVLRASTGWIGATVLAMSDAEVGIIKVALNTIDRLDSIGDASEVDESAVPNVWHIKQCQNEYRNNRTPTFL